MQTAAFVLLPESTSPARGTTGTLYPHSNTLNDFNPHPPHGGRRCIGYEDYKLVEISIHVPRTGDDGDGHAGHRRTGHFNPRPPARGTTSPEA